MTSIYNLLREACGISQLEAAENVHQVALDTVKGWSSDRRPAPQWAINQLQSLQRRIQIAGETFAQQLKRSMALGYSLQIGDPTESEARAHGFPSVASAMRSIAVAIALLPDDAEIRLTPRAGLPKLDPEIVFPTATDRQVLEEMTFESGRFYTAGNMNRRKYERLEDIGWIKGIATNISDVEYHLTVAGALELALLAAAGASGHDVPDPAPGGLPVRVNDRPRTKAHAKLKVGLPCRIGEKPFLVTKIDGDVVTAQLESGSEVLLSAPPELLG